MTKSTTTIIRDPSGTVKLVETYDDNGKMLGTHFEASIDLNIKSILQMIRFLRDRMENGVP